MILRLNVVERSVIFNGKVRRQRQEVYQFRTALSGLICVKGDKGDKLFRDHRDGD
jgi:hypothetical protein